MLRIDKWMWGVYIRFFLRRFFLRRHLLPNIFHFRRSVGRDLSCHYPVAILRDWLMLSARRIDR